MWNMTYDQLYLSNEYVIIKTEKDFVSIIIEYGLIIN
jgi:hypothetical protein